MGRGNADGGWAGGWGQQERIATDREQTEENYRKDQGYTMARGYQALRLYGKLGCDHSGELENLW